jgi:AmmeMemoRadiSam system protein B
VYAISFTLSLSLSLLITPLRLWLGSHVEYTLVVRSKRVFILGPSHHVYMRNCALSSQTHYETPIGDLTLDLDGSRATTSHACVMCCAQLANDASIGAYQ